MKKPISPHNVIVASSYLSTEFLSILYKLKRFDQWLCMKTKWIFKKLWCVVYNLSLKINLRWRSSWNKSSIVIVKNHGHIFQMMVVQTLDGDGDGNHLYPCVRYIFDEIHQFYICIYIWFMNLVPKIGIVSQFFVKRLTDNFCSN